MDAKKFVKEIVVSSKDFTFEELKKRLIGEYITFNFLEDEQITREVFAEKLFDYFEKLEIRTGKNFDKTLDKIVANWDSLVSKKIEKEPSAKKKGQVTIKPRAREYYEVASDIRNARQFTMQHLMDYSRIIMCLYASIIDSKYRVINDFDYSIKALSLDAIISSMKTARASGKVIGNKAMFDTEDLYCIDTSTFILTIMLLCYIIDRAPEREY